MSVLLYHFTSQTHARKIRRTGLTRGMVPCDVDRAGNVQCRTGYQWLTQNPDWAQPWCLLGQLPYARNAVRLTIVIQPPHDGNLAHWPALAKKYAIQSYEELSRGCDPENWWLYCGRIPPNWVISVDSNPNETLRPEVALNGHAH